MLTLVRDCLEAPAFPLDEIERVRGETLNNLREMEDNTRTRADLRAHALLYPPEHPYSRASVGTRESVQAIDREALDRYNRAVERLKSGDWKGFGTQFDAMRELLEEMNRQSTGH